MMADVPPTARQHRFNWRVPLFGAIISSLIGLRFLVYENDVDFFFTYVLILGPLATYVALLIFAIRKTRQQRITTTITWLAYVAATVLLFMNYGRLRPTLRWWLWSQRYKAAVLAQPQS